MCNRLDTLRESDRQMDGHTYIGLLPRCASQQLSDWSSSSPVLICQQLAVRKQHKVPKTRLQNEKIMGREG